ncbi:MAG: phospholipase D family protein [Cyanobacteria bacterium P01_F01_bin.86]
MTSFTQSHARRIGDRAYYDFTLASIEAAKRRIWVSLFIFDIRPSRDLEGYVLNLCTALIERRQRGVDVRVLTTGHVNTPDIAVANIATGLYLDRAGVPQRRIFTTDSERNGSHAKFAIFDDVAISGSQNWTDDAFSSNIEDAVLLTGDIINLLATEFATLWNQGRGLPRNAAQ